MSLTEVLTLYPVAFVSLALILGLLVGSFLNVLVWRLPKMLERDWRAQAREVLGLPPEPAGAPYNLLLPHSQCPHCAQPIRPWENIPLLSYLFLRGRCQHCKAAISPRYPLTELACGLISAFIAWHFGFGWQAGLLLILSWGLIAMSLIDADHQFAARCAGVAVAVAGTDRQQLRVAGQPGRCPGGGRCSAT